MSSTALTGIYLDEWLGRDGGGVAGERDGDVANGLVEDHERIALVGHSVDHLALEVVVGRADLMRHERHGDLTRRARRHAARRRHHRVVGYLGEAKAHLLQLRLVEERDLGLALLSDRTRVELDGARLAAQLHWQRCASDGQLALGLARLAQLGELKKDGVVATRRRLQRGQEAIVGIFVSFCYFLIIYFNSILSILYIFDSFVQKTIRTCPIRTT